MVPDSATECYRGGAFLARCVPLAAADARLDANRRTDLARTYADRAIELLRESLRKGYSGIDALKSDRCFDALRSRGDFRDLLANGTGEPPARQAR